MSVIRYSSVKSQEFPNFYKTERHPVSYSKLKCLAKALFDNNAESPDELAFRKGDILTVLEQNTRGLEGWWLCALRGRQGIVPGNRVRLIPGMYEPVESGYETKAHAATSLDQVDETNISPSSESTQRIWHLDSKKVVTPQKLGYVDVPHVLNNVKVSQDYDVPKSFNSIQVKETKFGDFFKSPYDDYDTPTNVRVSYDLPITEETCKLKSVENSDLDVYDIPRSAADLYNFLQGNKYDDPDGLLQPAKSFLKEEIGDYDIPKSCSRPVYNTKDMPLDCDTRSGLTSPLSLSSSSTSSTKSSYSSLCTSLSNRCSMEDKQEPYDIPFRDPRHVNTKSSPQALLTNDSDSLLPQEEPLCDVSQCNILSNQQTSPEESMQIHIQGLYDVPPRVTRDPSFSVHTEESGRSQSASGEELQTLLSRCIVGKELPLERRTAIELCTKRYEDVNSAIQMLFNYVNDKRNIRSVCKKLKTTMHEFIELALGALSNCTHSSDKGLSTKLAKLLKPLIESSTYIEGTIDMESYTSEELDKLVVCACSLVEDLKLVACFIRGNSSLIFKRSNNDIYDKTEARTVASDFSSSNSTNKESTQVRPSESFTGLALEDKKTDQEWLKQYDCVKLKHVDTSKKENWKTENAAVREVKNPYDNHTKSFTDLVQKERPKNITSKNSSQVDENGLDSNELQLLHFYKYQIEAENIRFTNSIDAFLVTIRNKQPPKIFLQHCKSVIISASRIVYIGDTVHKNVNESTIKTIVFQKSNTLWDSIKYFVTNAKKAASIFPSAVAIQEMEESIVDVSSKANDLKAIIGNIC